MFGAIVAIVSAVVAAVSTAVEYENTRKANSKAADAANEAARQAEEQAQDEADAYSANARALIAKQQAAYAASGFALGEDDSSPLTVLAESSRVAAEERDLILKYGAYEANTYYSQASQYSDTADTVGTYSFLGVSSTLLSGLSKAA